MRFDPTAQHIASGSMDRSICESQLKLSILLSTTDASSTNDSTLEHIWAMRELWRSDWPSRGDPGFTMVERFTVDFFGIGGHDTSELGLGNWAENTTPRWARGDNKLS